MAVFPPLMLRNLMKVPAMHHLLGYLQPINWCPSPIGRRIKSHSSIEHLCSRKPSPTCQRQWHEPFVLNHNVYDLHYYDGFQKKIKARGDGQKEMDWETHWIDLPMELDRIGMYNNTTPPWDDSETKLGEGFYDGLFQAPNKDIQETWKDFRNDKAHYKTVTEQEALANEFFAY